MAAAASTPGLGERHAPSCILRGPGDAVGAVSRRDLLRILRVGTAARRCHELLAEGHVNDEALAVLLQSVGAGEPDAVRRLGLRLEPKEASDAAARVQADLVLLSLEDDPDLVEQTAVQAVPPRLMVTIVKARGLRDADWIPGTGKSDPYCCCEIPGKPLSKFQTLTVDDCLDPVWDRTDEVCGWEEGDPLDFTVWDQNIGHRPSFLGRARLESRQYFETEGFEGDLKLQEAGWGIKASLRIIVKLVREGDERERSASIPVSMLTSRRSSADVEEALLEEAAAHEAEAAYEEVVWEEIAEANSPTRKASADASCGLSETEVLPKPVEALAMQPETSVNSRLKELPAAAAEALRWLAWHEAWYAALACAASGNRPLLVENGAADTGLPMAERLKLPIRKRLAEKAREAWSRDASGFFVQPLAQAAAAAAQHTASRCVVPKQPTEALQAWRTFDACLKELEHGLHEDLIDAMRWLLWNASWHAAMLVSQYQSEDSEDEEDAEGHEDEDDEAVFGEDYLDVEEDHLKHLANFIWHSVQIHRSEDWDGSGRPWRGVIFPRGMGERDVHQAASAGFSVIRLPVPMPSLDGGKDVLGPARPLLEACVAAGVPAVLDLLDWSCRGHTEQEAACKALASIAVEVAASFRPGAVVGVALPHVSLPSVAPLVAVLREAGLSASTCAAIVQLDDSPADEEGEYSGMLQWAMRQGEQGLLISDGHIVLELCRQPAEDVHDPRALLDEALREGEGIDEVLPLSCVRWNLDVPVGLAKECELLKASFWQEEFSMRREAGCEHTTHGWFAKLDDNLGSLCACLGRHWRWPDPMADCTLWPHGCPHVATLVYMHGFESSGSEYVSSYEYFYRDVDGILAPYPGLKVVLPTAPLRSITAWGGTRTRSWYDYLTDHDGKQEDDLDLETLEEVVRRVHATLDAEAALLGRPGAVWLGGTSQGAAVALHAGLSYHGRLGGVLATQGHMLTSTSVPGDLAKRGMAVRIFNGLDDETMPWDSWVSKTFERLKESGADVKIKVDEGVEHCDNEAEGRWCRTFLAEMWCQLGSFNEEY
mmetsp:Transcript_40635/g.80290  ORF Transcript_40635/g.80290 Transcript_40635/m.80290 type:complete len:1054 (-) Transcript_40635:43-3204(-)